MRPLVLALVATVACTGGGRPSKWRAVHKATMLQARAGAAVVGVGRAIYVIGGVDSSGAPVARVDVLDVDSGLWETAAPLPAPAAYVAAVAVAGRIVVAGALPAQGRTLEHTGAGAWRDLAPMPLGRGAAAAAAIGDRVYIAGGLRDGVAVADFAVFDARSGTWQTLPDLPTPRSDAVGAAVAGRFYVLGGSGLDTVQEYDPAST
jgi:N-acetylneuraminic acid mutarotase